MALKTALLPIAAFFLTVTFSPPAFGAGETLSLKELLELARKNNPGLKSLEQRLRAKEARIKIEGSLDDPTLKVEIEDIEKNRPLKISPSDAMLTRYTVSQSFPFPGKLSLKEKIAGKEALAAAEELKAEEIEILTLVKEAYFEYAFLTESLEVTGEAKELIALMTKIAGARYSTGQVPQQDVIKVGLEGVMLTGEVISLEAQKEISAARLKSLVNISQDISLAGAGGLPREKPVFSEDKLVTAALEKNPRIKSTEIMTEAGDLSTELARKNYYPDFMVGVAPIQRDTTFDRFDLMFQINIPIWRGKYAGMEKEASLKALSSRAAAASEKNLKNLEIRKAAAEAGAAEKIWTLYETGVLPQAITAFESALKNYEAGKVDFLTLLETERELKRTKLDYLKAILEYRKHIASLEGAVGEDFF